MGERSQRRSRAEHLSWRFNQKSNISCNATSGTVGQEQRDRGVRVSVSVGVSVRVPGAKTTLTAGSCCQHANATLLTHTIDAKYNDDDDGKLLAAYKFVYSSKRVYSFGVY